MLFTTSQAVAKACFAARCLLLLLSAAAAFAAAPTVTSVTPKTGPMTGGTAVTITGTNFTGATAVTFGGSAVTSIINVVSDTTITCTTPAHAAGAVSVLVTTSAGTNAANTLFTFLPPPPFVDSVTPAQGPKAGGTAVAIDGTSFLGATSVVFGTTAATTLVVINDNAITCTTPAHAVGTVSVLVTTAGGTNAANSLYTYLAAPTVSSVSPNNGPTAGGAAVNITGANFTGATAVTFGGAAAMSVTVVSDTTLSCITPAHAAGKVSVLVTTAGGTNAANSLYTYIPPTPSVASVTPNLGPAAGGQTVTISGSSFTGATAVTFGGAAATSITVVSDATLTCTTPAHATGTVSVLVTTAGGANPANSLFTFVTAPTVVSITPNSGPTAGGTAVTITGTNFTAATVTAVTFGGTVAASFNVLNNSVITCITPADAAGSVSVDVTTAGGTNAANGLYTFVPPPPSIVSVTPAQGPLAGGEAVTISGANFSEVSGVDFGGVAATNIIVASTTTITCVAPANPAGAVSVAVTTAGGANAPNSLYTYTVAPIVLGVAPNNGPLAGGQPVTIFGTNFTPATVTAVTFGGVTVTAASVDVVSDTVITCVTPAHAAGVVSIAVTTGLGTNPENSLYAYLAAPRVNAVTPNSGPTVGSQPVTILGANFTGASGAAFGGLAATNFTVVSDTAITCTTPAHAAGTASVLVTAGGGTNAANSLYTYIAMPSVSSITPNNGPTAGGTAVTITGTNFAAAKLTLVDFGGAAATNFKVVTDTAITCTTPAHAAGAVSVDVTTALGANAPNNLYTYIPSAPTVASVTPNQGPLAGGQWVTITGTSFSGVSVTAVTFGGIPATNIAAVSDTAITCLTPAHAVGAVSVIVTTTKGANAANSLYTYVLSAPSVASVTPNQGPTAGGTAVTLTGTNFTAATVTAVAFGGIAATAYTVVTGTVITCITPAHAPGAVSVNVTTGQGTNAANSLFTFIPPPPSVVSVTPNQGYTVGLQAVTINGAYFTGATAVLFGGVTATSIKVVTGTAITCLTPPHAAGTVSVLVTTLGGTNAANSLFTYLLPPPVVSSVTPVKGPVSGGQAVTIRGTYFTAATVTAVTFGGVTATSVTVVNDSTITCATPANAAGKASVAVTTAVGTNPANSLYTYVPPPSFSGQPVVTPASPVETRPLTVTVSTSGTEAGVTVTLTFSWGAGEGADTVATVTGSTTAAAHTYASAGNKTVTLTLNDSLNAPVVMTLPIVVTPTLALLTKPPPKVSGSYVPATAKAPLTDIISFSGALPALTPPFTFTGQTMAIAVGGAVITVPPLTAKNSYIFPKTNANFIGAVTLKPKLKKGAYQGGPVPFSIKVKGNFLAAWQTSIPFNPAFPAPNTPVTVACEIDFGGNVYVYSPKLKLTTKVSNKGLQSGGFK